jgi:hypothetical protein
MKQFNGQDYLVNLDGRLTDAIPPVLALWVHCGLQENGRRSYCGRSSLEITSREKFNDLEPRQRRRATLEALKRILIREA